MPFACIGTEPLTEKIALRLLPTERIAVLSEAVERDLSVSALVRQLYFGAPIISDVNRELVMTMISLGIVVRSTWDAALSCGALHHSAFVQAVVDLQRFARSVEKNMTHGCVHRDRFADAIFFDDLEIDRGALSVIVTIRVLPLEKSQLQLDAELAGLTTSALIRQRIFGRPVSADIDRIMRRRIRSLMAMLQHFIGDQRGLNCPELYATRSALAMLFRRLAHDFKTHS